MIPCEAWVNDHVCAKSLKEIIRIGEHDKRRRAEGIGGHHVKQLEFDGIREIARQDVGVARSRIDGREFPSVLFELAGYGRTGSWLAADVEHRGHVKVNVKGRICKIQRRVFFAEERLDVGKQFANRVWANGAACISTGHVDAIAAGVGWRASRKVVVLVRRNDEDGVLGSNAIVGKTSEEFVEGVVIRGELLDVA